MNLKIHSTITLSILAFPLIAAGIPVFENVYAQGEGEGEDTGGTTSIEGGLTGEGNTTGGILGNDSGTTGGGEP